MPPHAVTSALYTLYLFTASDFVTCLLPVTAFACVAAPVASPALFARALVWNWVHLLQCNVSNQYSGRDEDAVNKPWRPIAAGRISAVAALRLRWALPILSIALSAMYGQRVVITSLALTLATVLYDEMGFSSHWFSKNITSAAGCLILEAGTSMLMGVNTRLDDVAIRSLFYSACIITSTIHCSDFPDVIGDLAQGRTTLPILCPKGSRAAFFFAISAWSWYLAPAWALGRLSSVCFIAFGIYVGWRVWACTSPRADKMSYVLYNFWLLAAVLLPANARWGVLSI